ncbi:MAG: hypothetical protein M3468_07055 [Acidobacteriota bacterium]|nr:hypothetical protein [Acidobacteriota bacterium]
MSRVDPGFMQMKKTLLIIAKLRDADHARKHRIPVIGHLEAVTCAEAVRIGIDSIEHGITGCVNQLPGPEPTAV